MTWSLVEVSNGEGIAMTEFLASWEDGAAKQAIQGFIEASTAKGPRFVEPADRIATFDNDGTLWVEKPAPPQADFLIRAWTRRRRTPRPCVPGSPTRPSSNRTWAFSPGW